MESFNPSDGTHLVAYTDGSEEWLLLSRERVHLHLHPGEVPPPPAGGASLPPGGGRDADGDAVMANGEAAQVQVQVDAHPDGNAVREGQPDAAAAPGPELPDGVHAVGWRISVYFPTERHWCVSPSSTAALLIRILEAMGPVTHVSTHRRDGAIDDFDTTSGQHRVAFDAPSASSDTEWLCLRVERIRVLEPGGRRGVALARVPQGIPVWGKVKGYPSWPALVVGEADLAQNTSGRIRTDANSPVAVQYFGSAEHGRLALARGTGKEGVLSFEDGLTDKALLRGVNAQMRAALIQLEEYLLTGTLPDKMGGGEEWPDEPVRTLCLARLPPLP